MSFTNVCVLRPIQHLILPYIFGFLHYHITKSDVRKPHYFVGSRHWTNCNFISPVLVFCWHNISVDRWMMDFLTSHLMLYLKSIAASALILNNGREDREGYSEGYARSWIIQTAADHTCSFTWLPPSVTACTSVRYTSSSSYDQFIKVVIYPTFDKSELDVNFRICSGFAIYIRLSNNMSLQR